MGNGDGANTAANGFSGALATLTATAATIGAATGGLAFLLRNSPTFTLLAFVLATLSAVLAVILLTPLAAEWKKTRAWVLVVSAMSLFVGLYVLVWTQSELLKVSSRPVINAEWVSTDANAAVLRLTINASSLARDDILYSAVTAIGSTVGAERAGTSSAAAVSPQQTQILTLYSGSTGPDTDGLAKQSGDIVVPREAFSLTIQAIEIAAVVIEEKQLNDWSDKLTAIPVATTPPPTAPSRPSTRDSASPSPNPATAPKKARITSLDCDGQVSAIDSLTGLPLNEGSLDAVDSVSCVNIATLPEADSADVGTPK